MTYSRNIASARGRCHRRLLLLPGVACNMNRRAEVPAWFLKKLLLPWTSGKSHGAWIPKTSYSKPTILALDLFLHSSQRHPGNLRIELDVSRSQGLDSGFYMVFVLCGHSIFRTSNCGLQLGSGSGPWKTLSLAYSVPLGQYLTDQARPISHK